MIASTPPVADGMRVWAARPSIEIAHVAADDRVDRLAGIGPDHLESRPCLQIGEPCAPAHALVVPLRGVRPAVSALEDQIHDAVHRPDPLHLAVLDADPELALDRHHDLQRVDRVEAQSGPEQRTVVRDLVRAAVEVEPLYQGLLDLRGDTLALLGVRLCLGFRLSHCNFLMWFDASWRDRCCSPSSAAGVVVIPYRGGYCSVGRTRALSPDSIPVWTRLPCAIQWR